MVFSVVRYGCELDHKDGWMLNCYFWAVVLAKTLESPLDYKEIKPVNPKGKQSWIFIRRTDAEVEGPIAWPPDAKSWFIRKVLDAGKDWRQEEKGRGGRDGWMSSLTQCTWVWASSGRWWMTGKCGMLQSMEQRVGHNWATEKQQAKTKSQRSLYMHTLPSLMASNTTKQKLQEGEYSM